MYIDYCCYVNGGGDVAIDMATFQRLEFRARKLVDRLTQNRIRGMKEVPEAVKRLMVELIPLEATLGAAVRDNQPVTSFSNDGYSETYADPLTEERLKEIECNLIREYLSGEKDDEGVPLLFLGVI